MSDPDPDDDPRLKSLRAVWLSLPDEEPPQRGLAELMAAARVKAEVMARPAWWRRLFDVLRRPPVLALATVVVLVGGAVLVGKEKDAIEVERRPPVVTGSAPAGPSTGSGSAMNDRGGAPAEVETTAEPAKGEAQAPAADLPAAPPPRPSAPKQAPKALKDSNVALPRNKTSAPAHAATKTEPVQQSFGGEDFEAAPAPASPGPAPAPALAPEPAPTKAADPGATRDAKPAPAPAPPKAPAPARKPDSAGGGAAAAASDEAAPSVSRLIAQCRAAATRGDCATVKALAAQIASQDQAAYRAQIAGDSAIRHCLGN